MIEVIATVTSIVGLIGIVVVVWSIIDTRRKYFEDYVKRKGK